MNKHAYLEAAVIVVQYYRIIQSEQSKEVLNISKEAYWCRVSVRVIPMHPCHTGLLLRSLL